MTSQSSLAIEATGLVKGLRRDLGRGRRRPGRPTRRELRRPRPNGAGKTTTIRMLATLLRPDLGSARVLGHNIVHEADAVRSAVSLTGQLASVDENLTGRENLILIDRLLGLKRAAAKVRATELPEASLSVETLRGRLVCMTTRSVARKLSVARNSSGGPSSGAGHASNRRQRLRRAE
jgi:ABC-2 type transport system ATP-binding protein